MRLLYSAVICIATLFGGLYAQSPPLSPSFSFRATGVIIGGQTTIYDPFLLYNDAKRGLLREEVTDTAPGQQINRNALISRIDNVTFVTLNDTCGRTDSGLTFGVLSNADPWGSFSLLGASENVRTYASGIVNLITTNGVPTSLTASVTFNGQTVQSVLTITSYTDSAPAFSVFQLDSACVAEGYTCGSCYSSAIGIASNFVYVISALVVLSILGMS